MTAQTRLSSEISARGPMIDIEIKKGLLNLHDAFLNADIMQREKWDAPVEQDPEKFHVSNHGRFERMWITFLYVLVEAWQSPQMAPVRAYIQSVVPLDELAHLLRAAAADGSLAKMSETRHYMCHRDRRKYWDDGRLAVCGQLEFHIKLHASFSQVLLAAMKSATA
jgi:hypothetical protein